HVLLTKSDKLSRGPAAAVLQDVRRQLAPFGEHITVQLFSSLKKSGVEEAERVIGGWLGGDAVERAELSLADRGTRPPGQSLTQAPAASVSAKTKTPDEGM